MTRSCAASNTRSSTIAPGVYLSYGLRRPIDLTSLLFMNTLMHRTASFLPEPFVKGLSWISRDFSLIGSLYSLSKDPVKRAEQLEYDRAYRKKRRREDETYRESVLKTNNAWLKKKMADRSWQEATLKRMRVFQRQQYQDKEVAGRMRFRGWLTHNSKKLREGLIWKTHVPILYKDKVKHTCVGCGYPPRGGLKLWWQQISDPSQFKCHPCYCSPDVSKAMPVGYEDMVFRPKTKSRADPSGAEVLDSQPLSTEIESKVHTAKEHAEDEKKST